MEIRRNPKELSHWLESKNPALARIFLNATTEVTDPPLLGMGVRVEEISDSMVSVGLPYRWKNRSSDVIGMSSGALVSVAEYATRLLWERHYDATRIRSEVLSVEIKIFSPISEKVWARPCLIPSDWETCFFTLNSTGTSEARQVIPFFDQHHKLLAQAEVEMSFIGDLALPPGE